MNIVDGTLVVVGGISGGYRYDIEQATVSPNGTVNTWSLSNTSFHRRSHASAIWSGRLYILGGDHETSDTACKDAGTSWVCNNVKYSTISTSSRSAIYERTIDTGSSSNLINSFVISGSAPCSYTVKYATAGSSNIYGSTTTVFTRSGTSVNVNATTSRYIRFNITLDDSSCGGTSTITDLSLTYNNLPSAPILLSPISGSTNVSTLPEFRLGTTDSDSDYIRYKIDLCSTSNCSSIVRTIDQTSSQTGWQSQSQQSATAYSSGASAITQYAIHKYQTPALSNNTQYWWRGYAIDPGGNNNWSDVSSISSFTTESTAPQNINIGGGTTIYGGTTLQTGN